MKTLPLAVSIGGAACAPVPAGTLRHSHTSPIAILFQGCSSHQHLHKHTSNARLLGSTPQTKQWEPFDNQSLLWHPSKRKAME